MFNELFEIESTLELIWQTLSRSLWRYLLFAGLPFVFFYVWKANPLRRFRIQKRPPRNKYIMHELKCSLITRMFVALFTVGLILLAAGSDTNYTMIYMEFDEYGWGYFIGSILLVMVLHDAYFYWTHRLMHHKRVYKYVHRVHHKSINPTPFASFSFHPSETFLETMFVPLIIFVIPVHPIAIVTYSSILFLYNVYAHSGFEFMPKWWVRNPVTKYFNTPTNHNQHHGKFNYNYGLYFNWWDRWMGTHYEHYETVFEEIKSRPRVREEKPEVAVQQAQV